VPDGSREGRFDTGTEGKEGKDLTQRTQREEHRGHREEGKKFNTEAQRAQRTG
jgi:hypothetical protein